MNTEQLSMEHKHPRKHDARGCREHRGARRSNPIAPRRSGGNDAVRESIPLTHPAAEALIGANTSTTRAHFGSETSLHSYLETFMERLRPSREFFEGTRAEEPPPRGRRRLLFPAPETTPASGGIDRLAGSRSRPVHGTLPASLVSTPDSSPSGCSMPPHTERRRETSIASPPTRPGRLGLPRVLQQRYPDLLWDRRIPQLLRRLTNESDKSETQLEALRELGDEAVWSVSSAKQGNGIELMRDGNVQTFFQTDGAQPHKISIQFRQKTKVSQIRMFLNYQLDESYTPNRIGVWTGTDFHDLRETVFCQLHEPRGWITIPLPPPAAVLEFDESGLVVSTSPAASPAMQLVTAVDARVEPRLRTEDSFEMPPPDEPMHTSVDLDRGDSTLPHSRTENSMNTSGLSRTMMRKPPLESALEVFHLQIVIYGNHQNGRDSHIRQIMIVGPREQGSDLRPSSEQGLFFTSKVFGCYAVLR